MSAKSKSGLPGIEPEPRKLKTIKRRPARKQVEVGEVEKKQPEQTGQTFNVWYHKWAGGDKYDSYNVKEKSQTRCSIEKDSGYTRADAGGNAFCCLFFARGCCPYGSDCSYLHRLPPSDPSKLPDSSKDVFGREKHSGYRDDMGGVGSFSRINRTLYIGRLKETKNTEEVVLEHFEEWGDIERVRVLNGRGVAFVTYVSELGAQFGKEAMMHQSLDSDEVLNVRWATEDPNPKAKVLEGQRLQTLGEEGIGKKLDPNFVEAVRKMDELEGIVEPLQIAEPEDEHEEEDARPAKRTKVIEAPAPAAPSGLLSAHALQSLQVAAKLRQQNGGKQKIVLSAGSAPAKAPPAAGLGLAGYGSDSDED